MQLPRLAMNMGLQINSNFTLLSHRVHGSYEFRLTIKQLFNQYSPQICQILPFTQSPGENYSSQLIYKSTHTLDVGRNQEEIHMITDRISKLHKDWTSRLNPSNRAVRQQLCCLCHNAAHEPWVASGNIHLKMIVGTGNQVEKHLYLEKLK